MDHILLYFTSWFWQLKLYVANELESNRKLAFLLARLPICKNMTRKYICPRKDEYGSNLWCIKRLERQHLCGCSSIQWSSVQIIIEPYFSLIRTRNILLSVSLVVFIHVLTIPLILAFLRIIYCLPLRIIISFHQI
jgi:hypothetical protein